MKAVISTKQCTMVFSVVYQMPIFGHYRRPRILLCTLLWLLVSGSIVPNFRGFARTGFCQQIGIRGTPSARTQWRQWRAAPQQAIQITSVSFWSTAAGFQGRHAGWRGPKFWVPCLVPCGMTSAVCGLLRVCRLWNLAKVKSSLFLSAFQHVWI